MQQQCHWHGVFLRTCFSLSRPVLSNQICKLAKMAKTDFYCAVKRKEGRKGKEIKPSLRPKPQPRWRVMQVSLSSSAIFGILSLELFFRERLAKLGVQNTKRSRRRSRTPSPTTVFLIGICNLGANRIARNLHTSHPLVPPLPLMCRSESFVDILCKILAAAAARCRPSKVLPKYRIY